MTQSQLCYETMRNEDPDTDTGTQVIAVHSFYYIQQNAYLGSDNRRLKPEGQSNKADKSVRAQAQVQLKRVGQTIKIKNKDRLGQQN